MKEQISALMDGELDDLEARSVFVRFKQDAAARAEWEMYHLIGDSLRQPPLWNEDFSARFAEKIAAEPTVLAPPRRAAFRRPVVALSAAASLAAVSLVAWTAFQLNQPDVPAAVGTSKIAGSEGLHDVHHYLVAHQEYSAAPMGTRAAIPGAASYLSVSLDRQYKHK